MGGASNVPDAIMTAACESTQPTNKKIVSLLSEEFGALRAILPSEIQSPHQEGQSTSADRSSLPYLSKVRESVGPDASHHGQGGIFLDAVWC